MFDGAAIQTALREFGFDGWLLCDFRGSNSLARRVLHLPPDRLGSRRWYYFVPAQGEPRKLVHRIEFGILDHLPGARTVYLHWQELEAGIAALVHGARRVAMEYSPRNRNPYVARVDAGTVELVRSCGVDVESSGDLIQLFEATWDDDQWAMHREAERHTTAAFEVAWSFIAREVRERGSTTERAVQTLIAEFLTAQGCVFDHSAIVAVNANAGNPHYAPHGEVPIGEGDLVLIDLWAKLDRPRSVYSDLTRMGYVGSEVPARFAEVFAIVARARDAVMDRLVAASAAGELLPGWQLDEVARNVITEAGYGEAFVHRTGHSLGQETHGNGANLDNLETRETRCLLPGTAFTIEPGIYLPEFGLRSEVNVFLERDRTVRITGGPPQAEIVPILNRGLDT